LVIIQNNNAFAYFYGEQTVIIHFAHKKVWHSLSIFGYTKRGE
jgi:lipopolysaccharide biosynthesis glycosyltransferase